MITISGVSKSYSGGVKAVDDLNMEIADGKIIGFLGPNGAGKTTTIKMITGILKADEGEIVINNYNINTDSIRAKNEIGFVSDDSDVFLRLKGIEYLNFMADVYSVDSTTRQTRIKDMADKLEMTNALKDRIQSYSHGMRQKIVIMGALIHNPNVWILDEPLTGLDPKSSYVLKEMMRDHVKNGKTVFFSTHVLEVAEKLCDEVAIVSKGKIIYQGDIETLKEEQKKDSSLESLFLEMIEDE